MHRGELIRRREGGWRCRVLAVRPLGRLAPDARPQHPGDHERSREGCEKPVAGDPKVMRDRVGQNGRQIVARSPRQSLSRAQRGNHSQSMSIHASVLKSSRNQSCQQPLPQHRPHSRHPPQPVPGHRSNRPQQRRPPRPRVCRRRFRVVQARRARRPPCLRLCQRRLSAPARSPSSLGRSARDHSS